MRESESREYLQSRGWESKGPGWYSYFRHPGFGGPWLKRTTALTRQKYADWCLEHHAKQQREASDAPA